MIIKFLSAEVKTNQENRKQVLIGKIWQSRDAYNFLTGLIGTKRKGADWNFSEVTLHPGDRIFVKTNKWKTRLRDPSFLLYVEQNPVGAKLGK